MENMIKEDDLSSQLWLAVVTQDIDLLRDVIDAGIDINSTDRNGNTTLHTACCYGDNEVAQELIDYGSDVNHQNENGQTALHLASDKGHAYIVLMLLDAGANKEIKTKYSQMTALHLASKNGHEKVVKLLKEKGADTNTTDFIGKTPYHYYGNHAVKEILEEEKHFQEYTNARQTNLTPQIKADTEETIQDATEAEYTKEPHKKTNESQRDLKDNKGDNKAQKNLIINHKLKYSSNHKARMNMNVFDRLTNPKRKK